MTFDNVNDGPLEAIWTRSAAFERFRDTAWMPEPCASCDRREVDWGGCRCQALALAGDAAATDPVCHKSPLHLALATLAESESVAPAAALVYRGVAAQKARV
jgi:pyrroloquinoline quinone biosynthesis protein E